MIKVLIVQGDLFDPVAPTIRYDFPDIETALPSMEEAVSQGCWACMTEENEDEG